MKQVKAAKELSEAERMEEGRPANREAEVDLGNQSSARRGIRRREGEKGEEINSHGGA